MSGVTFKIDSLEMPKSESVRTLTIACAVGMLLWVRFLLMEELLLKAGILNTKNLSPLLGTRIGTAAEYLLNERYWDAVLFLLFLPASPSFLVLVVLMVLERRNRRA